MSSYDTVFGAFILGVQWQLGLHERELTEIHGQPPGVLAFKALIAGIFAVFLAKWFMFCADGDRDQDRSWVDLIEGNSCFTDCKSSTLEKDRFIVLETSLRIERKRTSLDLFIFIKRCDLNRLIRDFLHLQLFKDSFHFA